MEISEYIKELVNEIKANNLSKPQISRLKLQLCKKYNIDKIPTDTEVLLNANIDDIPIIRKSLLRKPTRTISGVAVIAMMTKPYGCPHGTCTYCPGGPNSIFGSVPQSYTGKEPSTLRSIRNHYDPYIITFNRLEQYYVSGHFPEKAEVIIQGGTFNFYPMDYQEYFVKYILKAMNDFSKLFFTNEEFDMLKFKEFFELPMELSKERTARIHNKILSMKYDFLKNKSFEHECNGQLLLYEQVLGEPALEQVQLENETAKIRCVGLTIETKPDYGKLRQGNEMLELGCTRVEVGVQSIYNEVLRHVNRGHTVEDTIESFRILKDLGFKITAHYMPGLPLTTREMDEHGLRQLFENPDFRPDMLKIYPCMVLKGTALYSEWKKGSFKPMTTKEAAELIAEFKRHVPKYCRIVRVQRDIPTYMTDAGVDKTNLRQYIDKIVKEKGIMCNCIRCREAGINLVNKKLSMKDIKIGINVEEYVASQGKEFFISADDEKNNILFGYCRLRFPSQFLRKEITERLSFHLPVIGGKTNLEKMRLGASDSERYPEHFDSSALIRELHIYSQAVPIGKISEDSFQHRGIGKALMKKAEEIAKLNGKDKMVVISGIGAREYFRKLGYEKEGFYMVKKFNNCSKWVLYPAL